MALRRNDIDHAIDRMLAFVFEEFRETERHCEFDHSDVWWTKQSWRAFVDLFVTDIKSGVPYFTAYKAAVKRACRQYLKRCTEMGDCSGAAYAWACRVVDGLE